MYIKNTHTSKYLINIYYNRSYIYLILSETLETLKNIFFYKLTGLNFLLVLLFFVLSFYTSFAVPFLFLLTSNLFDILGYHFTLIRRSTTMPEKEIIKAYRINQLMFDVMLFIFLGLLFGWVPAFCGVILKLFGAQDVTYYIFLRKPLPQEWHWLRWTPFGWFKNILTRNEVVLQAVTGLVICIIILLFYFKLN